MTDRLGINFGKERNCHTADKDKHWKFRKTKEGRVEEESLLDAQTRVCLFHRRALSILSHIQYIILKIALSPV